MSGVVSRVLTKGWRVGGGGGKEIDFKMEADHDWSPEIKLHG